LFNKRILVGDKGSVFREQFDRGDFSRRHKWCKKKGRPESETHHPAGTGPFLALKDLGGLGGDGYIDELDRPEGGECLMIVRGSVLVGRMGVQRSEREPWERTILGTSFKHRKKVPSLYWEMVGSRKGYSKS